MLRMILVLSIVTVTFLAVPSFAGNAQKEKAAIAAAEQWLGIVDSGKYSESWGNAATIFRKAVNQKQWEQSLDAVRKPLGKLLKRKIKAKTFSTSLPGAPDGEYVVIQYETTFERKETAIETVTPMKDTDGAWRVSGYYIK